MCGKGQTEKNLPLYYKGSIHKHMHPQKYTTHIQVGFSLIAQLVKNPPAVWETWVLSLGWEDPLVKGKATHSSVLALRIPWTV